MNDICFIESRQIIDKNKWDSFVNASDEAWLWHLFDFQDTMCTWANRYDHSFVLLDTSKERNILAVLPLHLIKGKKFLLSNNYLVSFGGIAFENSLGEKYKYKLWDIMFKYLKEFAKDNNASVIEFYLPPTTPAYCGDNCPRTNPLLNLGFKNSLTQTWMVDLQKGKELLWNRLEGRARTAIKKAIKNGVTVKKASSMCDLDIYYKLHCETYKRTGATPHPRIYFEEIWKKFLLKGYSQVFFAECNNDIIAAENFAIYKKTAVYWTGVASQGGLNFEANSLLQWTAMQWMVDNGVQWYETGEAFPNISVGKLKGLNDFKKSFGGDLYPNYKGEIEIYSKKRKIIKLIGEIYHEFKS